MSYMKPYDIHLGNCLEVLKGIPDNSVDSIVTDPPYGLSFMGKKWDYDVPDVEVWEECLRVLKPGGHLLAFAGTRTQHRMAVRIEDAGFEIRDMIAWVYGSGFPKSMDVSKAIDKAAGAEREVIGIKLSNRPNVIGKLPGGSMGGGRITERVETAPATDAAREWQGWGTALKPALEPITVARKPFKGTVAANVLEWGTGAINIDGGRVGTADDCARKPAMVGSTAAGFGKGLAMGGRGHTAGRWPANLIHDGSDEVVGLFPVTTSGGGNKSRKGTTEGVNCYGTYGASPPDVRGADKSSAARFFYCAKTSRKDRGEANTHPTVKPTDLMAYLCRLVTPPGGVVLDPFMGSGSTGKAAMREGFRFIGIEMDESYLKIAEVRIAHEAGK
ncbi:MAG: hypothetical protein [Caudoviricetes sp.]|nr:MAG: hypothetical protein [Caudoviricetes sp.]